eukprot:6236036-Heterocapsa_arctica.AAC.1
MDSFALGSNGPSMSTAGALAGAAPATNAVGWVSTALARKMAALTRDNFTCFCRGRSWPLLHIPLG